MSAKRYCVSWENGKQPAVPWRIGGSAQEGQGSPFLSGAGLPPQMARARKLQGGLAAPVSDPHRRLKPSLQAVFLPSAFTDITTQ